MIDIIVIYTDETIFTSEDSTFKGSKTPAVSNGEELMRLVRVASEEDVPAGCNILGTYEQVFENIELKALYDSIYQREYTYIDEEGNEQTGMKPEQFGVFA